MNPILNKRKPIALGRSGPSGLVDRHTTAKSVASLASVTVAKSAKPVIKQPLVSVTAAPVAPLAVQRAKLGNPEGAAHQHPPGWYHNGELSSKVFDNNAGVVMINIPTMNSYLSEICLGCASDYELSPNMYGLAHILEHMKCKAIPGGLDRWKLQGGAFQNASTNMDRTDFYALLPGHALKQSINIYAEQQGGNYVTDVQLAAEQPAVLNEWERSNTTCMRRIMARLHNLANVTSKFRVHETIGFKDTIMNATADDLNNFANRFYTTDRASLLLVGNFSDVSFKNDIMSHVHSVWGGLEATTCQHSRNEFDRVVPLTNVGNREELMFVDEPGYNFVATCVPIVRADMDVSIVNLLASYVMNGSTGHLQQLVSGGFVQCVEAQASRTMASTPLFQIAMNCRCDMAQARGTLTKLLHVLPSNEAFVKGKQRLMEVFTNVFSDATQAAEAIPQMMSYNEGCGVLAAHDLVTRCAVLSEVTYEKFTAVWTELARRFSMNASTLLVKSSTDQVKQAQNIAPVVASQLHWSEPHVDVALNLLPTKMTWDLKSLESHMHPIYVNTIHTDKVHVCGRLPSSSVPYMMYLRHACRQPPPNTSVAFDIRGDHIGFALTSKWESSYNATQWLTSIVKADIGNDTIQAVEFSVNDTYHTNPQCAVDYSASSLLTTIPSDLNVSKAILVQQRDRVLRQSTEITLTLPKVMRHLGASVDCCHAEMRRVGSALQSGFRIRAVPINRPLYAYEPQPSQTQKVACKSSISVCTIMLPCDDLRDKDLASLTILNSALGGDFNSMLMQHVRLELGLTYSTSSSIRMATTTSPMCVTCTGSFSPEHSAAGTNAIQSVIQRWSNVEREHFEFGKRVTLMRMASLCDIPAYGIGHSQFLRDIGTTQEKWAAAVQSVEYADVLGVLENHVHFNSAITVASTTL